MEWKSQVPGLTHDLTEYLRTLKAVHSGADLDSAAEAVLGYRRAIPRDSRPLGRPRMTSDDLG